MTRRKYNNPPVQEALCEIFFSGAAWDSTVPGAFYHEIEQEYPKKGQLKEVGVEFSFSERERIAKFLENNDRMQFRKSDGSQIVQIGQNLFVVNQLKPYPRFEEWFPVVKDKFKILMKFVKPAKIEKIGVRYINRIVIPKQIVRMEEYFDIFPELPKRLGDQHGPFMLRLEVPAKHPSHRLLVTFATAPATDQNSSVFALDLYDIYEQPITPDIEQVVKIATEGHENIEPAFEGCIKDSLRTIFDEEKT